MNPVTRKYMELLGRIQVNDRGNTGIVWHAGNKPHAQATGFGGSAAGNTVQLNLDTASANITASQVSAAMQQHILSQTKVRRIHYKMTITGNASPAGVAVNAIALGVLPSVGSLSAMGDISPLFSGGDDISLQLFTDYYEKLYNRYKETYINRTTAINNSICHGSCHSNCHSARGRR